LDAYVATRDNVHLEAACAAGEALLQGQLVSGGWYYSIEFDPELRKNYSYRVDLADRPDRVKKLSGGAGRHVWQKREFKGNITMIDDDTTTSAIRFLSRLDELTQYKTPAIGEAVRYAVRSLVSAQYPVGAWSHNYDRFPLARPDAKLYPILRASYPEDWERKSQNDFLGCYYLNDRITLRAITTLLFVHHIDSDKSLLDSALQGGEFLLRAQMPEPQPAWAQQYSSQMQPVWDRKFEPPAITGEESQDVLHVLMDLYVVTRDPKFLEPIPRALNYLEQSQLPDGHLARFYELKTNRPLYFNRKYELTYEANDLPDHYGFVRESRLKEIRNRFISIRSAGATTQANAPSAVVSSPEIQKILAAQASDGAWLTPGFVRDSNAKKVTPKEGVVDSAVFIANVKALCEYLKSTQ
jgi:hypothetical protein